jgi:hypothetical protein
MLGEVICYMGVLGVGLENHIFVTKTLLRVGSWGQGEGILGNNR